MPGSASKALMLSEWTAGLGAVLSVIGSGFHPVAYPGIRKRGATPKGGGIWPGAHIAEGGGMSRYFFPYALMATAACRESFVT